MRRAVIIFGIAIAVVPGARLVLMAQAGKTPATVVLKGSPLGGVKFDHTKHEKLAGKCDACHHASRPEKPNATPNQRCQDCHTTPAKPPMKTRAQFAFHDGPAKKGLCVNCHLQQAATAKPPQKCADCHKKENS
ncbi:MAG: cytochrome c3 family protein [Vicinamibacterales bacterium]